MKSAVWYTLNWCFIYEDRPKPRKSSVLMDLHYRHCSRTFWLPSICVKLTSLFSFWSEEHELSVFWLKMTRPTVLTSRELSHRHRWQPSWARGWDLQSIRHVGRRSVEKTLNRLLFLPWLVSADRQMKLLCEIQGRGWSARFTMWHCFFLSGIMFQLEYT